MNWKEIVQNYIIKHSNRIRKATRPLRDHFGIDYFTYHRIDETGKYTVLVDRPDWAEHYVQEQIFLDDPYLRHPSVYQSGISLFESHGTDEYRERVLKLGKDVLNVNLGAIIIQKRKSDVEFFGFSCNAASSCLQSLYLNRPQILHSFAAYFKKQLNPILNQMEQEAGSLVHLKGSDFFCNQAICPDLSPETCQAFYRDLGILENGEKLSPREKQCIKLLIEGKTAKETGATLGLSPRTIEFYFENIKNKLSCWSKQEILKIGRNLNEAGLLS